MSERPVALIPACRSIEGGGLISLVESRLHAPIPEKPADEGSWKEMTGNGQEIVGKLGTAHCVCGAFRFKVSLVGTYEKPLGVEEWLSHIL